MKNILFYVPLLMALTVSCNKYITGEGPITDRNYSVPTTISQLEISSAINLTLSDKVEEGAIIITTSDNIHDYISVLSEGGEVSIELRDGNNYRSVSIDVTVSSKQYNDIEASGACDIEFVGDVVLFDYYTIELSGASEYNGNISVAKTLNIDLSGASEVNIEGSAPTTNVECSGASEVEATDFVTDYLIVDLSGASKIRDMRVNDNITGELSGASKIDFTGLAEYGTVQLSDSSSIDRE